MVENTGESQLGQITIKDLDLGIDETDMTPLQYPDGYLIDGILEPLEFVVFYYEGQISTNLINTALAQGTPYENNEPIGDPVQDDDAAEVRLVAQLGDWVWRDSDGDGRQDAGEIGVPGVTVRLYTSAGTFAGQTTTDASGYYSFTNLAAGSFYLVFSLPGGYAFSPQDVGADTQDSDPNPATGQTAPFTLTTGQSDLTRDAGLTPLATIGDYVWIDMNMDGIQGVSEAGLGGVTVNLYGPQGNLVDSTMTNASGYYEFTDVPPGDYYVDFGLPAGYGFTAQDQGADDGLDSDASPTNGQTSLFTVVDGQDDLTRDAGSIPLAAIGDRVWRDTDADGIQDAGESGYAGVTVRLYDELGNLVATTTTGATGIYQFTSIMPGSYYLEFVPPSGWVFSDAEQSANEELDSDPDPISGLTEVFTVGGRDRQQLGCRSARRGRRDGHQDGQPGSGLPRQHPGLHPAGREPGTLHRAQRGGLGSTAACRALRERQSAADGRSQSTGLEPGRPGCRRGADDHSPGAGTVGDAADLHQPGCGHQHHTRSQPRQQ